MTDDGWSSDIEPIEEADMAEARAPVKLVREKWGYSERNEKALKKKTFHPVQVIAVTSGKGGVGKTNVVANLAYSVCLLKQRVLILDADMGLANLDVLLGLIPKYTIQHILMGERTLEQIMIDGPGGMKILPASLGIQELTELTAQQRMTLLSQLELLNESTDLLLIDTASGISSNVMFFNTMANEIVVCVSPEPTSITAAYAMIKLLAARYAGKCFHLLANFVRGEEEGLEVYRQLSMLAEGALNLSIHYLGSIPIDPHVQKAVKQQRVVTELYPDCPASRSFLSLAKKIIHLPVPSMPRGNLNLFWRSLTGKSVDHQEDTISL